MKKLLILLPFLLAATGAKYPLHEAVRQQDLKAVEQLLAEHRAGMRDGLGRTPLHIAAMGDWVPGVQLLRARGVPINTADMDGMTPLHLAAAHGAAAATRALLAHGANMQVKDQAGKTPLHAAAEGGHVQIGQALIERGANVNAVHNRYQTPLHYAAKNGHLEMTFLLLARGADSKARDTDQHTPLDKAIQRHQHDVAMLLSNGMRPSHPQDVPVNPPEGKKKPRLVGLTGESAGDAGAPATAADGAAPPEMPVAAATKKPQTPATDAPEIVASETQVGELPDDPFVAEAEEAAKSPVQKPARAKTTLRKRQAALDGVHDLAAVLPAQSLFYVGWSGDEARAQLPETAMDKLLAEPQVRQATTLLWAQVQSMARGALESHQAGKFYEPLNAFLELLWRKPSAITLMELQVIPGGGDIQAAFVVKAGSEREQFIGLFESLLQAAGLPPAVAEQFPQTGQAYKRMRLAPTLPAIVYLAVDDFVVIALGEAACGKVIAAIQGGPNLAKHPEFAAARKNMHVEGKDVLFSSFVDVAGLINRLEAVLPGMAGPPLSNPEVIDRFLDASGLAGLKTFALATAVHEGGYRRAGFLSIEGPRKGLLRLADQAPVQDQDLRVVPRHARFATAFNFDWSRAYEDLLSIADQLGNMAGNAGAPGNPASGGGQPAVGQMLRFAIAGLEQRLGCRLKEDLLDSLGDTFVFYDAPSGGDNTAVPGWTLVAEVKDADKIGHSIRKIIDAIQSSRNDKPIEVRSVAYKQREVRFVEITNGPASMAVAWSIDDGRLIVALSPLSIRETLDLVDANNPQHTLLANADFQRGRNLLPKEASSVSYLDTRNSVGALTEKALPFIQMMSAMSSGQGGGANAPGMPTPEVLTRHLFGDVAATAATEDGILWVSHGPLPLTPPGAVDTSQIAQLAGLMPPAGRPANRGAQVPFEASVTLTPPEPSATPAPPEGGVDLTPLELIAAACTDFAQSHGGAFPPDLETLVQMELLPEQVLRASLDHNGQSAFGYVPDQTSDHSPGNILVYHRSEDGRELTVLFIDGHVEVVDAVQFARLMRRTNKSNEPPLRAVPAAGQAAE